MTLLRIVIEIVDVPNIKYVIAYNNSLHQIDSVKKSAYTTQISYLHQRNLSVAHFNYVNFD